MNKYQAITTCNSEQWKQYGRAMITTFCRYWPRDVSLCIYTEGFSSDANDKVEFVDLDTSAPWLPLWKSERSKSERGWAHGKYHFRKDAVRFSHKIAAIGAAAESVDIDVLIWMDADIVTHAPVTIEWLEGLFPQWADMAWLDRERVYPECGFMMFRIPEMKNVIRTIKNTYKTGEVFRFTQTHDSFVIQQIVNAAVARGEIKVESLSGEGRSSHHPFVNSPLASRMDHLKGSRKVEGRSRPADLIKPRTEPYWQ